MAEIPHIDMDYVADLARIELSEDEKQQYLGQMKAVFEHFARLDELDVSDVEPTAHAAPVFNVWREDVPGPTLSPAEAVANAPEQRDGMVKMPRVVAE